MTLTPEQIENWRNTLLGTLGPYALIMPEADLIKYRDMVQSKADALNLESAVPQKSRTGLCKHNVRAKHCMVCK